MLRGFSSGICIFSTNFVGSFHSEDRERRIGEKTDLLQNGSLIPINMLMGEFTVAELYDHHERYFHGPVGGGNTGQHPRHFLGVGE